MQKDRLEKILDILSSDNYCSASKLSQTLFVSLPTIRRDLANLEKKGLIIRCHGGAKKIDYDKVSPPFDFKKTYKMREKKILCEKASKFIHDNDVIFLDDSTSVLYIIDYLKSKKNLTVVTNGLATANLLGNYAIKTYLLGGLYLPDCLAVGGEYSQTMGNNFNFDIMIFSACGTNHNGYIVDTNESIAQLRKHIMNNTRTKIFISTAEKFGLNATYNVCKLSDVDIVICDNKIDDYYAKMTKKLIYV